MTNLEYLQNKYGLRLTVSELALELKMRPKTIICNRSAGKFDLPMVRDGKCIYADSRDVAAYLDKKRATAT
jgi:hypothetical protein